MAFGKYKNITLGRREATRIILITLAIVAAFCWAWVLEHSLENERDALENRYREQQEKQLKFVLNKVKEELKSEYSTCLSQLNSNQEVQTIHKLINTYSVSAVITEEPDFNTITDNGQTKEDVLVNGVYQWPSDADGRDALAARLVINCDEEAVWSILLPRLIGNEGPPMKSSFRYWLLAEAKKKLGGLSPDLEALLYSEGLRAEGEPATRGIYCVENGIGLWWDESAIVELFEKRGIAVKIGKSGENLDFGGTPWKVRIDSPKDILKNKDSLGGYSRLFIVGWGGCIVLMLVLIISTWIAFQEQRVAQLKTDLTASVAHELRTPLAGQRVLLETLFTDVPQSEAERKEYLEMTLRENLRLCSLVEQFLTFSRLDRGKMLMQGQDINISILIDELLTEWRDRFDSIIVNGAEEMIASIDKEVLYSILRNLVENAWKYTGENKQLKIEIEQEEEIITLFVQDNGPGLTNKEKTRVLQKFWRVDQKLNRQTNGLGLGLFIVKKLTEAHGGNVKILDAKPTGTIFKITLEKLS